ncbi:IS1096 element passenger TnpR family protein [Metallosphaera hakonensis]|uniref:Plasmid pRiA4b Orf3-like domain-containing protein n=1 Tax=Metallosphaera hakonensis JCM 8857 = DSM 7519 TaxID=1293036 RepID=A0A2U9IRL5_9CREN|nr:hypothetical protein [Metallosphaera hakonensis]AWR98634.1 hypothetical protein DFR87_01735 [Metallosphaera hakonensis JCM 8857 = DSM 7519]
MVTHGKCLFCEKRISSNTASAHFKSCEKVKEALNGNVDGFILKCKDRYSPEYWLYIAVPSSFTLKDLDQFLRAIWVDCCDHLSEFEIGDQRVIPDEDKGIEILTDLFEEEGFVASNDKLSNVLYKGLRFGYVYDFGSSTELELSVVDTVRMKDKNIYVLGRNEKPKYKCVECGKEAESLCYDCLAERDISESTYCEECLKKHEHGDENAGMIPNSPRIGVCGYTGNEKMEKIRVWPLRLK